MSDILVTGSGGITSLIIAALEAEGHEVQRCIGIAKSGSMSLSLITPNRRRGKRKAKNWDSPYPS